jgi:hypothetical protein
MALTAITKDFVVKAGAIVEGANFVSSSTGQTGTLQISGGAAIAKNLVVGTTATIWGNSSLIGSLNVAGASTVGSLTATIFTATSANIIGNLTVSGVSALQGILTVTGNSQFNGAVNTFSGALFVTGTNILTVDTGATSLGGTLTVSGKTLLNNTTDAVVAGGGDAALKTLGGVYVSKNLIVASTASSTSTAASNALYVAGGAYIDSTFLVQGSATFNGNVVFNGTQTNVYSTNTVYTDNLINLHVPAGSTGTEHNWTLDDGKDIGFGFHYYKTVDKNAFLGLANDSGYLEWYEDGYETLTGEHTSGTYGTFKTANIQLTGTADASSTITGAFQVVGGAGIGGKLYASLLAGRNLTTASGIVYSLSDGTLQNTPVTFDSAAQRLVGLITTASTAINVDGGAAGSLLYQSGASASQFLPIGTNGNILIVSGGNPTWSAPTGLVAGNATTASNIAGGLKDQIPFQSAPGQTVFNVGMVYNGTTFTTTNIQVTSNNNATAATGASGALMVTGGVGISRDLWVAGDINVGGNIYMDGVGLDTISGTTATFTQANITGTVATFSTSTGALQVGGGVGIGGGIFVGGIATATLFSGVVTQVQTTAQTANANYFPTFVDANNATAAGEVLFTTSSFSINPSTGATTFGGSVAVTGPLTITGFSLLNGGATISAATVTNNLLVSGNGTVTGFASLNGGATISAATVTNNLLVSGNETVTGFASLNGGATISAATVTNALIVSGQSFLNGGTTTTNFTATTSNIIGNETVGGTLTVTGQTTLGQLTATITTVTSLTVIGNETVGGTLAVTGFSSLSGGATISAATVTNNLLVSGNETVTGFTSLNGGATISALTVTNATVLSSTLAVTGHSTLGLLRATDTTVTNLTVSSTLGVTGQSTLDAVTAGTTTVTNLIVTGSATLPSNVSLSNLTVTNLTVTNNQTVGGNLQVTGLFTVTNTANFTAVVRVTNATDSNATGVGALVVTGGVGIAKNLTVGTGVTVGASSTQTVVPSVFSNNVLYSSYTSQFIVTNSLI